MKKLQNKIPAIRFPGFEEEWEEKKLGDVGEITTGSTPSTLVEEYYNGNRHFVSPRDIQENRYISRTIKRLTDLGISKGRLINKNDVVFVCIGSTIGKVGQVTEACITNQQINTLAGFHDFNNDFIYTLLELKGSQIKLLAAVQAVPQINKTDFSEIKLSFPSLPEQKKIADFFSVLDKKIKQLQEKKKGLTEYKKGIMQQIFSQELRFKDENGKDFPAWEEKKLGEVLRHFKLGGNYENSDNETNNPLIKMGNLRRGNISLKKIHYINNSEIINEVDLIKYGDLFFNTRNTLELVGKVSIWRGELNKAYYNSNLMRMKFENNFYMNYWFNSKVGLQKLKQLATGTTSVAAIYTKDLLKIKLSIPNLKEQLKIADFLSKIDDKINTVEKQIQQTRIYKKGLLQKMFV